ncbi:MAG TPA: DUF1684 domain-containing protein [Candidatus Acidoferrales bacterium]|nr:DUF1684 domain-containing protein [Candidatus Acidoferrales bacterium]
MKSIWLAGLCVLALASEAALLRAGTHEALPDRSSWLHDLNDWRTKHAAEMDAPDGWLSLTGLDWLKEGDNSFGSAPDNAFRVAGGAAAHVGDLHLQAGAIHLLPPTGGFPAGFLVDGQAPQPNEEIRTDSQKPSTLTAGTLTMLVIHRGDRFALRVKDSRAPARVRFRGLHWFPPNETYVVHGKWIPYNPSKTLSIATVIGTTVKYPCPGAVEFTLQGKPYRLEPVVEEEVPTHLFFIMRDTTSADASYGAGRFLYTPLPEHGLTQAGEFVVDFNHLENPPCAYSAYATCPLPPPQNRLPIALPVGEKKYHD